MKNGPFTLRMADQKEREETMPKGWSHQPKVFVVVREAEITDDENGNQSYVAVLISIYGKQADAEKEADELRKSRPDCTFDVLEEAVS